MVTKREELGTRWDRTGTEWNTRYVGGREGCVWSDLQHRCTLAHLCVLVKEEEGV